MTESLTAYYLMRGTARPCVIFSPVICFLPIDRGLFQRIPYHADLIEQAHDSRKNCERPFNLLKNQTGLETIRVRSQNATLARCALSSIAVLLIEMAGIRKKQAAHKPQQRKRFSNHTRHRRKIAESRML